MMLSVEMIAESMQPFGARVVMQQERTFAFRRVQMLTPESENTLEEDVLYVSEPKVIRRLPKGLLRDHFFVVRARLEDAEPVRPGVNALLYDEQYSLGAVTNHLLTLFDRLQTLEYQMRLAVRAHAGLEPLMEVGRKMIPDATIVVVDSAYNIIGATRERGSGNIYVDQMLEQGYYDKDSLQLMAEAGYFEVSDRYLRPVLSVPPNICNDPVILRSYIANGMFYSFAGCYFPGRLPTMVDQELFRCFTEQLDHYFRETGFYSQSMPQRQQMIHDLLRYGEENPELVRDRARGLRLPETGNFRLGYLYYGPRGTAWSSLDTQVEKRIYQVNAFQQRTRGEHHRIHVSEVTALCRADHPLNTYHYKAPDALDARIAAHILPLVRDGDTLQVGIGGIPNAVAYGLHGRKRLGIYTEVLTQAQLRLMASGAVDLDRVEASIVLDAAGHLDDFALAHIRMIPVDVLNDPFRAAQQPGLISVNGCLMADLTGQVCAEAIDGRQYSGVGGQLDFVRAAARSAGGRSFLCLHSTHEAPDGTLTSNIRAHLPSGAVVTTPRSDVMYIVTEWGAADLHNQPLETRICAMIRIAHPRFRCALAQEAVAWGQLSPECAAQFDTQPEPEKEETT